MKTNRNAVLKRSAWLSVMALVASLHLAESAQAQATSRPPERMTYQGFIAGSDGVALGNTAPKNYDVIFRIYDGEGSNTPLWGEQQTVTVDKGYFSVLLGEGAAVPGTPNAGVTLSSLFNSATASDRYVSFTVKGVGSGGTDIEILPRVRLMSSPYAFLANRSLAATKLVQDDAAGTDLLTTSGNAANLNGTLSVQGDTTISGRLNIWGGNAIQLGAGIPGKEGSAGQIGYGTHSGGESLDIVGAGTTAANRKVRFYGEGGIFLGGPVTAGTIEANVVSSAAVTAIGGIVGQDVSAHGYLSAGVGVQVAGTGSIVLGIGRTKAYPLNGSIMYTPLVAGGDDTLLIQGGGNAVATRSVTMLADGGFNLWGPLLTGAGASGAIRLGQGSPQKEYSAGSIGYQMYSTGLDIVGAGNTVNNRQIYLHTQGGLTVQGPTGIGGAPDLDFPFRVYYTSGTTLYSAHFASLIGCSAVVQFSDRRIKDVTGTSASAQDLETLRKIRVTDYRMKDAGYKDERNHKGVIAQELQPLLPDAVTQTVNVIPNIQQDAASVEWAEAQKIVTVRLGSGHGISVGNRVRLKVDGKIREVVAASIPDEKSFTYTGSVEAPTAIRVIGREVKDFLSVDYQQINMTAVSALQEVDRRLQAVDQRVQEVEKREARVTELEAKMARLADLEKKAARVENLERDMAELRKLVAGMQAAKDKTESASVSPASPSVSVVTAR